MILLMALVLYRPLQAMGLGEARVDSFLNQPLDVQVRLLEVSQADLDSLSVQIGSASDYERLGLMGDVLGLDISVSIDRSQSPPVVRVRSQRAVRDPVVQLLVDARWSSGRILREYTLFLDPATIPARPPRSQPEAASSPPVSVQSEPVAPVQQRPLPPAPQTLQAVPARRTSADQYFVQSGDTLWSVAQNVRPDSQLSMSQTMLAIVEMNPSAFRDGSVHQMLSGVQLDLPDREQISRIEARMAEQTIAQQNRAFNQRINAPVPVLSEENPLVEQTPIESTAVADDSATDQAEPAEPSAETAAVEPITTNEAAAEAEEFRLELVPPAEDEEGLGLSAEELEANRLRQQLAREEEEVFTARLEAEQLQERVAELETMINDNPSGVGIRDFNLAQLEQTLRTARLAASEQADPALRAEVSGQVEEYLQQFAAVPEAQLQASDNEAPVVTQIGESRSGLTSLFGNPLVLFMLGLIGLLVGLLLVWLRFKRSSGEDATDTASRLMPDARPEPSVSSESDVLERAKQQVEAQPENLDRHLKLLELLAGREDSVPFSAALERMYNQVEFDEQPQWQQALKLAEPIVPDHPLVLGSMDWDPDPDSGDLEPQPEDASEDLQGLLTDDERAQADSADEVSRAVEPESDPLAERSMSATQAIETRPDDLDSPFLHVDDREGDWQPGIEDVTVELDEKVDSVEFEAEDITDDAEDDKSNNTALSFDWPEASEGDAAAEDPSTDSESVETAAESADVQGEDDIFSTSDDDVDVKLDLARAYLSWNSTDSARTLLEEIVAEGNSQQREQAKKLLDDIE